MQCLANQKSNINEFTFKMNMMQLFVLRTEKHRKTGINKAAFQTSTKKRHRARALCPYIDHMCPKIKLNNRETIFGISNHRASLFPKWISATKPGPVWAPMTGPIES